MRKVMVEVNQMQTLNLSMLNFFNIYRILLYSFSRIIKLLELTHKECIINYIRFEIILQWARITKSFRYSR